MRPPLKIYHRRSSSPSTVYGSCSPSSIPTFTVRKPSMVSLTTQKALLLPARAGKWYVGEATIPRPGPQDVLVKVLAAALNPIDWKLVDSPFTAIIPEFPFISGTDGAGIVEEVGSEVTTLEKGDKM